MIHPRIVYFRQVGGWRLGKIETYRRYKRLLWEKYNGPEALARKAKARQEFEDWLWASPDA